MNSPSRNSTTSDSNPPLDASKGSAKASPDRLRAEMAAESQTEFYISPPLSEQAAIRAAIQNQEAYRADEAPRSAPDSVARARKAAKAKDNAA